MLAAKLLGRLSLALRRPAQYTCYGATRRQLSSDPGEPIEPENVSTPPIPPYTPRSGETLDIKRARLLYQSRKRGMLENGILLSTFAGRFLNDLTEKQLDMYDNIINQPTNDWDIYYWTIGKEPTPEEYDNEVMKMMQKHAKNEEMEERFTQPPLY